MARIRTIKPDFFLDPDISRLHPLARLLFIGLWTLADRAGRLEDDARRIGAQVLPYDACDIENMLASLSEVHGTAKRRFIDRYETSEGRRFIQIVNFDKHQRPHLREPESSICVAKSNMSRHNLGSAEALPFPCLAPAQAVPRPLDKGKGREWKGKEGERRKSAPLALAKDKPISGIQKVMRAFKEAKNIDADDADWDDPNFKRFARAAADVLKIFGTNADAAITYVLVKGQELDDRKLDGWGLEAIARAAATDARVQDFITGREHGTKNISLGADRLDGPRRAGGTTPARDLAGDALAGLHAQAPALAGPTKDQFSDDEPFA